MTGTVDTIQPVSFLEQIQKIAHSKNLLLETQINGLSFSMQGEIAQAPLRLEVGKPARNYIQAYELRARCILGLPHRVSLMLIDRLLGKRLREQANDSVDDDSVLTVVNKDLPEEAFWLTLYSEVGWSDLGTEFIHNYAIFAEDRSYARALINAAVVQHLNFWPNDRRGQAFLMMVSRGSLYLRMQFDQQAVTLWHVLNLFERIAVAAQTYNASKDLQKN